jgi:CubicO group peptidase (beta-lactamase class C family)
LRRWPTLTPSPPRSGLTKPAWTPGERHGYHAITLGWYESELIRRTDPQHRTIARYFAEEIAAPLGLEV